MKTTFTRTVPTESAIKLAEYIIETCCQAIKSDQAFCDSADCQANTGRPGDPCWGCPNRRINDVTRAMDAGELLYIPDVQSGRNSVTFPEANTVKLYGQAMSGDHTLTINLVSGQLTVTHDGYRASYPGNAMILLPEWWRDIHQAQEWKLVSYQSRQPEWAAIAGFLSGEAAGHQTRARNLRDAQYIRAAEVCKDYCRCAEAAGRAVPEDLRAHWDEETQACAMHLPGGETYYPAKWTGIEYRRAGSNGIEL